MKPQQILEIKFWANTSHWGSLTKKRMQALKIWNIAEIDRLDSLIKENIAQGDTIIDKMRQLNILNP